MWEALSTTLCCQLNLLMFAHLTGSLVSQTHGHIHWSEKFKITFYLSQKNMFIRLSIIPKPRDYKKNSNYRNFELLRSLNYQEDRIKNGIIKSFYYL